MLEAGLSSSRSAPRWARDNQSWRGRQNSRTHAPSRRGGAASGAPRRSGEAGGEWRGERSGGEARGESGVGGVSSPRAAYALAAAEKGRGAAGSRLAVGRQCGGGARAVTAVTGSVGGSEAYGKGGVACPEAPPGRVRRRWMRAICSSGARAKGVGARRAARGARCAGRRASASGSARLRRARAGLAAEAEGRGPSLARREESC